MEGNTGMGKQIICRNCGFELTANDTYCPKCGEKTDKTRMWIFLVLIILIAIFFAWLVMRTINRPSSDNVLEVEEVSTQDEVNVGKNSPAIEDDTEHEADIEENQAVSSEGNHDIYDDQSDDGSSVDLDNQDEVAAGNIYKGSYYQCDGDYSSVFDSSIFGKTKEEFFDYTGITEDEYQYMDLNINGEVYISERRDYSYSLNGLDVKANNIIYYRDGKVIGLNYSFDFNSLDINPQYLDELFKEHLSRISEKGHGVYYSDDLNNVISLGDYVAELSWKDDSCYYMITVDDGRFIVEYCSVEYIEKYKTEDIYAAEFEAAFREQENDIKAAP